MKTKSLLSPLTVLLLVFVSGCDSRDGKPGDATSGYRSHEALLAEARSRGPRDCADDLDYMVASSALGRALEQIEVEDYRRANILLRDGLEALGDVFLGDDVLDHTGERLSLAWGEEWEGRMEPAASIRERILESRLTAYAELRNLRDCPSSQEAVRMTAPPPPPTSR